ncbi:hypothetical protein [Terracidiphilus gabretensis]|uniref:hypothetical protein n=1 Tax=Terracidiphilus gabretensis TaxID=1577687 RepID=UPI00071BE141|nr:hypothetical protein [Terracidiphilus gabretensis]
MNQELLHQSAARLKELLLHYASENEDAQELLKVLFVYIQRALDGKILEPVAWNQILGGRMFEEGSLRDLPDLEAAYWSFKIEITGGESEELRELRLRMLAEEEQK